MVRELFGAVPDAWQDDVLKAFPHKQRIAMPSAKGPGKSTVLAWLSWNFLLTRPNPKIAATSISGDNLRDGLWTEMAKWQQKSPLLQHLFTWTTTRIASKENPEQWWMSARTWPQSGDATQQANTLAGLHADYIMFVIDESGGMTDAIMASAEAALSSCVEGHIVQAGNPTQLSGPLYRAWRNEHGIWYVVPITGDPDDPKRSPRIKKQWALDQIREYGRDDPWVRTNVFGEFPQAAFNSLIGAEEVRAAMKRNYQEHQVTGYVKVIGVDVAKYGSDSSVILKRQGPQVWPLLVYRSIDGPMGAAIVNREWSSWGAEGAFIDDTGGFGGSWIDQLRILGRSPIGVHFNQKAHNPQRFKNKRAEMYFDCANWIREGGALPDDKDLYDALISTTYTIEEKTGLYLIEPKSSVRAKMNQRSPDALDSLVLSFAEPISPLRAKRGFARHSVDWNPFAEEVDHRW